MSIVTSHDPVQGKSMLEVSLAPLPQTEADLEADRSAAASPSPSAALTADVIDLTESSPLQSAHDLKRQRIHSPRPAPADGPFRNLRRLAGRT